MKSVSLALSGGGSRGAYEIGAVRALMELGYTFDALVGTSIGSINGALIVQGDIDILENIWHQLDIEQIFGKSHGLFIDISPLVSLLHSVIDEEKLRSAATRFGLATFNLTDFKVEYRFIEDIPRGEVVDFILASSNFPSFKRQIIHGKCYIDGGVYDNLPVKMLYDAGYRDVISISVAPQPDDPKIFRRHPDLNEIYIKSSENLGSQLTVDQNTINRLFELGYRDTKRALKAYGGAQYYFDFKGISDIDWILTKKDLQPLLINATLHQILASKPMLRRLFIALIFSQFWKNSYTMTWREITLAMMELTGRIFDVNQNEIYTPHTFNQEILAKADALEIKYNGESTRENPLDRHHFILSIVSETLPPKRRIMAFAAASPETITAAVYLSVIKHRSNHSH